MVEPTGAPADRATLDVERVRRDFPALHQLVRGKKALVYLDSAATALKPRPVIDAVVHMYERDCANVHRGVHWLSQRATEAYEGARERLSQFLHAESASELVITRGTTEAINLVARSFVAPRLSPGDEILVTGLEHHSNIVPWQLVAEATGARLVVVPVTDAGEIRLEDFDSRLGPKTRFAAVAHVSNALGTVLPVAAMIERAHAHGTPVLVDGAQAVPHLPVDVAALDCDFYAFSGHKAYGPTGVGVLYGKRAHLDGMPPWLGGGDMIRSVSFEGTTFADPPHRFEAGTPPIAELVGLAAAADYLEALGWEAIRAHEQDLRSYGTELLSRIPGLRLIGTAPDKISVLSFVLDEVHPHDIGTIVDMEGVAIRTGHHCAEPLMHRFDVAATARASLGVYNTRADLEALAAALERARRMFA